jgi:hypothetical protein
MALFGPLTGQLSGLRGEFVAGVVIVIAGGTLLGDLTMVKAGDLRGE